MPSTMIHLLVAHEIQPEASGLFLVGNFAPDYTNNRGLKDKIHLRDTANRRSSLKKLYSEIDKENDFETGWFLHLFVDSCWDEEQYNEYKNWYEAKQDGWFLCYREEIGFASYYLYHHLPWSEETWNLIKQTQLSEIKTSLPIVLDEIERYRDISAGRHSESDPNITPKFFTADKIKDFSENTVNKYREWVADHK